MDRWIFHRKQTALLNAKYREYLMQWEAPSRRFLNRYNLFYDLNYWDRYWLKKVRKYLLKHHPHSL